MSTPTPLRSIGLEPGADAISHDPLVKDWFPGWTAEWPEGAVTWRLLFPDGFPRSDIWSGQLSVGAKQLDIHGRSWELEAAIYTPDQQAARADQLALQAERAAALPAPATEGDATAAGAAPSPAPAPTQVTEQAPWTVHRLGARNQAWLREIPPRDRDPATAEEQAAAEAVIRDRLLATAQEIHATANHDDALLWAQAYAWALMITRKQFNQLWAGDLRGEAFDMGEARSEIRAACNRDPWAREDLRRMTQHPRQEVRGLGVNIIQERARAADPVHQARLAKAREAGADIAAQAKQLEGMGAAIREAAAKTAAERKQAEAAEPAAAPSEPAEGTPPVAPAPTPPTTGGLKR